MAEAKVPVLVTGGAGYIGSHAEILATLDWRPRRDDLDSIVADPLAWERRLAARG